MSFEFGGRAQVLVVGGASCDTLHLRSDEQPVHVFGGAGLYTALAAQRGGAEVTMVGPRPDPMPAELAPAAERIDWRGPRVGVEELPRFELSYLRCGPVELRAGDWRAEANLDCGDLPESLDVSVAYCVPFSAPELQLRFLREFKARGWWTAAGTFFRAVREAPDLVRRVFEMADLFFCNEVEAEVLFGAVGSGRTRPGQLLFITRGSKGARVIQAEHGTDVAAADAEIVDPTGAGDVFAGTVLAALARGSHPVLAARRGTAAASASIRGPGPAVLLAEGRAPAVEADPRVRVDASRIRAVAAALARDSEVRPFGFVGDLFPGVGENGALDFFFASTALQFGFWLDENRRYSEPMTAEIGGRVLKGSDALFAVFRRWQRVAPESLGPAALAQSSNVEIEARLVDDSGGSPFPQLDERIRLLRCYGRDMAALGLSPELVLARANASEDPIRALLTQLDHIAGFKEDPLRKKSALLAAILSQRPEKLLREGGELPPIVDYHVQRSCLRMGLVSIQDAELEDRLIGRRLLDQRDHDAAREACYRAVEKLVASSGLSMGAVDHFLFQNRTRCPEMSVPECTRCPVDGACAHALALFQPVRRVTFY